MTTPQHQLGRTRTRWAAIGAAVAVTLGAGGLSLANAADGHDELVLTTFDEPCRLVDTRAAEGFQVGPRGTPLTAGEAWTVDANEIAGNCSGSSAIPDVAAALAVNVTAKNATAPTFLALYPANNPEPLVVSTVNPFGDAATPNYATVGLDDQGRFSIYNPFGTIDVFVDVTGYYVDLADTAALGDIWNEINDLKQNPAYDDSALWEEINTLKQDKLDVDEFNEFYEDYQFFFENTKTNFAEVWNVINNLDLGSQVLIESAGRLTNSNINPDADDPIVLNGNNSSAVALELPLTAPADGTVHFQADVTVWDVVAGEYGRCQINTEPDIDETKPIRRVNGTRVQTDGGLVDASIGHLSATETYAVSEGESITGHLACDITNPGELNVTDAIMLIDPTMTAVFVENDQ